MTKSHPPMEVFLIDSCNKIKQQTTKLNFSDKLFDDRVNLF